MMKLVNELPYEFLFLFSFQKKIRIMLVDTNLLKVVFLKSSDHQFVIL